jgi:hypothetical protein
MVIENSPGIICALFFPAYALTRAETVLVSLFNEHSISTLVVSPLMETINVGRWK